MGVTPAAGFARVGLLGGSFDPVHYAHLALVDAALEQLALDRVEILPACQPWQRESLGAPAADRLAMLELAIADHARVAVNPLEIERGGTTYTIDTLRSLGAGDELARRYVWLLGSDQLANFCTWRDWREIARRVELAVAARPGSQLAPPQELAQALAVRGTELHVLSFSPSPISATEIRRRVAAGTTIDGLTPPAVNDYIRTHHLYRA